jgi:cbb3-type cytochrome oxidase subunit 3
MKDPKRPAIEWAKDIAGAFSILIIFLSLMFIGEIIQIW